MTSTQWVVTLGAAGLIVWVQFYFFVVPGRKRAVAAHQAGRFQEVDVEVSGGYQPQVIEVRAGQPVRLNFTRLDPDSCVEEVVFGDFGIRRFLPLGQRTPIEFTPSKPGDYEFTCGMGMVRGKLRVSGERGPELGTQSAASTKSP